MYECLKPNFIIVDEVPKRRLLPRRARLSRVVVMCDTIEVVHVNVATLLGTEACADVFGVDGEFLIYLLGLEHPSADSLQCHQELIKLEVCCLCFRYFQE